MKYFLILLLIIFPLGQLLRFDVGNSVTIHFNDIIVGIIGTFGILKSRRNPLFKPIAFWVLAMVFSLLINFNNYSFKEILVSSLYLFRWIAYAGLFFFFHDFKDKAFLKKGLILVAVIVAILGIIQYLVIPDTSFLAANNWDSHYFRLISTFLDPGFTGAILLLGLLLASMSLRAQRSNLLSYQRWQIASSLPFLAMTIIFTALLFTYSRASYFMYLIGFAVIAFYKKSLKIFLAAALILFIGVSLLPKTFGEGTKLSRETSSWARIENWKQSLEIFKKAPVFGIGFDAYRYATNATEESHAGAGADSSLLLVLATTGVVGFLAYLNLLKNLWQRGGFLFKASLAAVFVHSWFNNTLFYPWVMEWLWLVLILDS